MELSQKPKCPMTVAFCEKYGITDKQVERFCSLGCSADCAEEFRRKFIAKRKEAAP